MVHIFIRNKSFRPYKSPITGEIITTPKQDRDHQARHDVVRSEDFGANDGQAYFDRKKAERDNAETSRAGREERLKDVIEAANKLKEQ